MKTLRVLLTRPLAGNCNNFSHVESKVIEIPLQPYLGYMLENESGWTVREAKVMDNNYPTISTNCVNKNGVLL